MRFLHPGSLHCAESLTWQLFSPRLLSKIETLHRVHGIKHGDLAPRNVVVDDDGDPRIVDFADASFHDCSGDCPELKYARELLGAT